MTAAYCNHQLMAPLTIIGVRNIGYFLKPERETCLMKSLKPGQWLVIDNTTFHKRGSIKALLEPVGCRVLYLPLYSPELNKTTEMLVVA
jgi:hypothetical protein